MSIYTEPELDMYCHRCGRKRRFHLHNVTMGDYVACPIGGGYVFQEDVTPAEPSDPDANVRCVRCGWVKRVHADRKFWKGEPCAFVHPALVAPKEPENTAVIEKKLDEIIGLLQTLVGTSTAALYN